MRAAIVRTAGEIPIYGEFPEPALAAGMDRIHVSAAAMSPLAKSRASGSHYSATGLLPFVVGIDGVGRLDDGRRVYFLGPLAPQGSLSERTQVPTARWALLPDELSDVTAAAIANPGMSSWAALTERARLQKGETVLVNGATGTAGRLAVQIAQYLGAGKVIATGRNIDALQHIAALGADVTIQLVDDEAATLDSFKQQFSDGIDVVVDYLWGKSAEQLLIAGAKAGPDGRPIRFIQIGSASRGEIALPSSVLRSSPIALMGSGLGSVPMDRLMASADAVLRAAIPGNFQIATKPVPLSDVAAAWLGDDSTKRTVFVID